MVMKKVFSVLLTAILMFCFGCTVFAEGTEKITETEEKLEIAVFAKGNFDTKNPEVRSVDINWTDMSFVYSVEETKKWNAENHSYDVESEFKWEKDFAGIEIINHSNVPVSVKIEYIPEDNQDISVNLSNPSDILEAGKEGDFDGADYMICELNISGTLKNTDYTGGEKIGILKIIVN